MPQNIPRVILAPHARSELKKGFDQLARLLAVTLGPSQGLALHSTELKPTPEPITDAATIARRITEIPERSQDVGAMLLRNLVWRVHQRIGDGSATTAVLAQAILDQASRYVAAGASPVRVQEGILQAARCAVSRLQDLSTPVTSQDQLAAVAYTSTQEPELSLMLSELFDLLGEHAHITIEDYMAPYLEREYVNGGQWQAKIISPYLISSPTTGKAAARDCNVVLFNGSLSDSEDALHIIRQLGEKEHKNLLLVAQKISGEALNTLVATCVQNKEKFNFVVVELVRAGEKVFNDLRDLSLLTGARLIDPGSGDRLSSIRPADMGFAARAEANTETLFVTGGKGDPAALREQIHALHAYQGSLAFNDDQLQEIKMRLARLSGSSGILKVGAYSKNERQVLHQKAQQGVNALHAAVQAGVLPGGGTAFLHCVPAVAQLDCAGEDEKLGCQAVMKALQRPFEQLLANAGINNPGGFANEIASQPPGLVFDLQKRKLAPAVEAGVLDAAQVLCACLETASSGARMALSTDVTLLKRNPRVTYEP